MSGNETDQRRLWIELVSAGDSLCLACSRGLPLAVRALLERGEDPNALNFLPLWHAACVGHARVAELLLDFGADVNGVGNDGDTPLVVAAREGHESVARLLLGRGADIDVLARGQLAALDLAARGCRVGVALLVLDRARQVDIERTDAAGPALHRAAQNGQLAEVRRLVEEGAPQADGHGAVPLHAACRRAGNVEVVRLLLDRAGADTAVLGARDGRGMTALHLAADCGDPAVVALLLARGADAVRPWDRPGGACWSALDVAAARGHLDITRLLVEAGSAGGARVSADDALCVFLAAAGGRVDVLEFLLERADFAVDQTVNVGWGGQLTALIVAAEAGQLAAVRSLLDHGANAGHSAESIARVLTIGTTALEVAVARGHAEVVRCLAGRGQSTSREVSGALASAVLHGSVEVVRALLQNGAVVGDGGLALQGAMRSATKLGHFPVVRCVLERAADVHAVAPFPVLLRFAAEAADLDALEWLVEHGASCDESDEFWGTRPLHAAAATGVVEVLDFLIRHGAAVDVTNYSRDTPLVVAACAGHLEAVRYLVGRGARLRYEDDRGAPRSALAEACVVVKNIKVVEYLLDLAVLDDLLLPSPRGWVAFGAQNSRTSLVELVARGGDVATASLLRARVGEFLAEIRLRLQSGLGSCVPEVEMLVLHYAGSELNEQT